MIEDKIIETEPVCPANVNLWTNFRAIGPLLTCHKRTEKSSEPMNKMQTNHTGALMRLTTTPQSTAINFNKYIVSFVDI